MTWRRELRGCSHGTMPTRPSASPLRLPGRNTKPPNWATIRFAGPMARPSNRSMVSIAPPTPPTRAVSKYAMPSIRASRATAWSITTANGSARPRRSSSVRPSAPISNSTRSIPISRKIATNIGARSCCVRTRTKSTCRTTSSTATTTSSAQTFRTPGSATSVITAKAKPISTRSRAGWSRPSPTLSGCPCLQAFPSRTRPFPSRRRSSSTIATASTAMITPTWHSRG